MAQIVCPLVSGEDRARLEAIVADRNRAQKHVARARVILASAERWPVAAVAKRAAVGRPAVWRWQRRFAEAGVDGLLRDATRKPGKAPLGDEMVRRVVTLTCAEPPGEATQWTSPAMAKTTGISLRSVQRIWVAHDLQPHRMRTFKRSSDPDCAAKLEDIVGLYVDPPKHAVVLSVDAGAGAQAVILETEHRARKAAVAADPLEAITDLATALARGLREVLTREDFDARVGRARGPGGDRGRPRARRRVRPGRPPVPCGVRRGARSASDRAGGARVATALVP